MVFPMISKEDHWTLLKFELGSGKWNLLNIKPRRRDYMDTNKRRAMDLVDYFEQKILEKLSMSKPKHPFLKSASKKLFDVDCIQQSPYSLDCGVIVCMQIERMLKREPILTGKLSHTEVGKYRSKMVEWFIDPVNNGVFG